MNKLICGIAATMFLVSQGWTADYCYWAADNCWILNGSGDTPDAETCENKSGVVVTDCENPGFTSVNCDFGVCVGGDGWDCTTSGGCYVMSEEKCSTDKGTVVSICLEDHLPPNARSSGSSGGTSSSSGGTVTSDRGDCKNASGQTLFCGYAAFGEYSAGCYKQQNEYSDNSKKCDDFPEDDGCEKTCEDKLAYCTSESGKLYTGVDETELTDDNGYGDGLVCADIGGTEVNTTTSSSSSVTTTTSSSSGGSGSSDTGDNYYVLKRNATNGLTAWGDYIFGYIYPEDIVTIDNETNEYGPVVYEEGVAKLKNVELNIDDINKYPGAMLGIKTLITESKNLTDCVGGLSYEYRGDAHWFLLEFDPNICSDDDGSNKWGKKITLASTADWKKEEIDLSSLPLSNTWSGAGCTNTNATPVDLTKVSQVLWGFDDKQVGSDLEITDIICITQPSSTTSSSSGGATTSSSSSVGGGETSSSSSGDAITSSSSSVGGSETSSSSFGGSTISSSSGGGTNSVYYCMVSGECKEVTSLSECNDLDGYLIAACNTPILNISSISGLTVIPHARSLMISSAKESKVQLYNMSGNRVMNTKVLAGHSVLSLEKQKQGVYYAVVQSGSNKQIVRVLIK